MKTDKKKCAWYNLQLIYNWRTNEPFLTTVFYKLRILRMKEMHFDRVLTDIG